VVVPGRPKAAWVQPRIKAEVEYRDITTAGLLGLSGLAFIT
jgi:hypothetical protein